MTAKRAGRTSHRLRIQKSGGAAPERQALRGNVIRGRLPPAPFYARRAAASPGLSARLALPPTILQKEGSSMIKIAPSILSADFANLERDIHRISAADYVHVDVMDGMFVPNISIGIPVVAAIRKITDLPLDVHLMIDRPIRYVEQFVKAGADYLTIHVEADQPQNTLEALDKIHALGCKAGIVLKPKTPAEAAIPYLEKCDMILVMTVEPGFGGQKFMADMMPKVAQLREWMDDINPECHIEVDGGVDANTYTTCIEAGADVLLAASVFHFHVIGIPDLKKFLADRGLPVRL
jgi:ribulose-phosphate 3-epimerase